MSKRLRTRNSKTTITLERDHFAGGGEGNLFKIASPSNYRKFVVKLYHEHKLGPKREEKINYLLDNPPHESVRAQNQQSPVVWVVDSLYDGNKFVGFLMPYITGEKLEILCTGKLSKKLGSRWARFSFKNKEAFDLRLRICFNIAAAIYQIHSSDRYVLVDLKPDNVIIKPNGLVSIVDTDSVEVLDEFGKAIFPGPVATPEYTPPEFYTYKRREGETVGEEWDRFSLAAIFYKLLFGIHPFTASNAAPYEGLVSLHEKIEQGLFVHAPSKKRYIRVLPPPHKQWERLPDGLKDLFLQCFEQGHDVPELRPTAEEWCVQLIYTFGDEQLKQHFAKMLFKHSVTMQRDLQLPSAKVKLPDIVGGGDTWVPDEVRDGLTTNLPALQKTSQPIPQKSPPMAPLPRYMLSWLVFLVLGGLLLFIIPSFYDLVIGTLTGDNIIGRILTIIVIINIPIILSSILEKFPLVVNSKYMNLLSSLRNAEKEFQEWLRQTEQTKEKLQNYVAVGTETQEKTFNKIQKKLKIFDAYVKKEDEKVRELYKKEKQEIADLNQKYMTEAQSIPALKNFTAHNLDALRERIEIEEQTLLTRYKRQMNITDDYKKSDLYVTESKKIDQQYEEETKKEEADYLNAKKAVEQDRKKALQAEQQGANKMANIEQNISKYLAGAIAKETQDKLKKAFKEAGITSIMEVKASLDSTALKADNGNDINLLDVTSSVYTLVSFIIAWQSDVATAQNRKGKEDPAIQREYNSQMKKLDMEHEKSLLRIKKKKEERLAQLELSVLSIYYKADISGKLKQYKEAKRIADSMLERYQVEHDAIVDSYTPQYDAIMTKFDQEAQVSLNEINALKEAHTKQIDNILQDPDYLAYKEQLMQGLNGAQEKQKVYTESEEKVIKMIPKP